MTALEQRRRAPGATATSAGSTGQKDSSRRSPPVVNENSHDPAAGGEAADLSHQEFQQTEVENLKHILLANKSAGIALCIARVQIFLYKLLPA